MPHPESGRYDHLHGDENLAPIPPITEQDRENAILAILSEPENDDFLFSIIDALFAEPSPNFEELGNIARDYRDWFQELAIESALNSQ